MRARPQTPGRVKPTEQKLTAGRPRRQPPPDAAEIIRAACATGSNRRGVEMALGVGPDILTRWLDEHPDLKEAFEHGRETERQTLHNVLYEAAGKGNIVAAMFLLKARHGYREGDQAEQGNRVNVTFNLPGALPLDKFVIDDATTRVQQLPVSSSSSTRRA